MQLCGREVVTNAAEEKELVLQKSVETLGVDLRTRTKQLGAKGKARRKKCVVSFFHCQEESRLSEELCQGWYEDAVEDGLGPCESVGEGASRRHRAHRELELVQGILILPRVQTYTLEVARSSRFPCNHHGLIRRRSTSPPCTWRSRLS